MMCLQMGRSDVMGKVWRSSALRERPNRAIECGQVRKGGVNCGKDWQPLCGIEETVRVDFGWIESNQRGEDERMVVLEEIEERSN